MTAVTVSWRRRGPETRVYIGFCRAGWVGFPKGDRCKEERPEEAGNRAWAVVYRNRTWVDREVAM